MGEADLVAAAVDELYALEPAGFTARRNALAAAARKAGAAEPARQIAALRRPTRAAWILNQLARAAPELAGEFAGLGEQLREAHLALDGAQIRELSKQRRLLIDQTAAQAFTAAGLAQPVAELRDDVTATLGAVLADREIAARFATGTLVTAEDQSNFGPVGAQLTAVPAGPPSAGPEQRGGPRATPTRPNPRQARADSRRQAAIADADQAVEAAEVAKLVAELAADEAVDLARQLSEQLADAKRREDDALLDVRRADVELQKAQRKAQKLRGGRPD